MSPKRYKNLDKAFTGFTTVCARGARGDYRGALAQLGAMPPVPPAGVIFRDALNTVLGELVPCKHEPPNGNDICPKCGWRYPRAQEEDVPEEDSQTEPPSDTEA